MKTDMGAMEPLRVAVIGRDGVIGYRVFGNLASTEGKPADRPAKGKVIFPFQNTSVHSDAWRASDHIRCIETEDEVK